MIWGYLTMDGDRVATYTIWKGHESPVYDKQAQVWRAKDPHLTVPLLDFSPNVWALLGSRFLHKGERLALQHAPSIILNRSKK